MRIAWFSPMAPDRSGIAAYSAEILPLLRPRYDAVDVFVDRAVAPDETGIFSAHDFVWKQRRQPYDLTVYQMGNATCHGYMWAYLFRYPGLVVLHDAQLHQSRALWLMKRYRPRYDDYVAEFRATEPQAPPDAAYVIAAGLGQAAFYQQWPLVRLVLERARLAVVHSEWLRQDLTERYPAATVDAIAMGVADGGTEVPGGDGGAADAGTEVPGGDGGAADAGTEVPGGDGGVRAALGIPAEAIVVAAFGGVTPEKRIGPLIRALGILAARVPQLRLLLVGELAEHYDVRQEAVRSGVADRVHVTGYVADHEVPAYLAAADICSCLRWPTNRETSASWLRCLAAGKPTLITALAQLVHLPPIAVSIDVLDEERALPQALESLATDPDQRARLGQAARLYWAAHHRLEHMAAGYERVIARAATLRAPSPALPAHLRSDGSEVLRQIAGEMGVVANVSNLLD